MDKYFPVYGQPSTFGASVFVTDLKIVDKGVSALAGACGRYVVVIHPSSTGMSTVLLCPDQRCFTAIFFFFLSPASCSGFLHPCLGLGGWQIFMAPYLLTLMACCMLARDGLGKCTPLLKPRIYYTELSPAGFGNFKVRRSNMWYLWAAEW